jgi:hypothetical protein
MFSHISNLILDLVKNLFHGSIHVQNDVNSGVSHKNLTLNPNITNAHIMLIYVGTKVLLNSFPLNVTFSLFFFTLSCFALGGCTLQCTQNPVTIMQFLLHSKIDVLYYIIRNGKNGENV